MKEKKEKIEKEVGKQDEEISKIKAEMPIPLNELEEENQRLLKALKKPKQQIYKKDFKIETPQFKG